MNRRTIQLFTRTKAKLRTLDFDELNVMSSFETLYSTLDESYRKKLKELYKLRYAEVMQWMRDSGRKKAKVPDDDELDDMAEMYLAGLLSEPNATVHYAWETEVLRKRDRAAEAVNSVSGIGNKQTEMEKHQRYIAAQAGIYADFTSQGAELNALADSGVKRVQRHECRDSRVCDVCKAADGAIYAIDKVPEIEHPHCRRWFTPVN